MIASKCNTVLLFVLIFGVILIYWPNNPRRHKFHSQPQPLPDQYGKTSLSLNQLSKQINEFDKMSMKSSVSISSSSSVSSSSQEDETNAIAQQPLTDAISNTREDQPGLLLTDTEIKEASAPTASTTKPVSSTVSPPSSISMSSSESSMSSSSFSSSSSENTDTSPFLSSSSSSWSSSSSSVPTHAENLTKHEMVHVDKTIIDKEMSDFLTDNNERLTKLKEECAKYMKSAADETNGKVSPEHLVNIKPKFHMFTLFPKESLVWCRTPKVGTTTWASIILQMYGIKITDHMSFHSKMKKEEKKFIQMKEKRNFVKKLASEDPDIIGMMAARHPLDRLYSAFKDKILKRRVLLKGVNQPRPADGIQFHDFIKYIVERKPEKQNRHWKPNWVLCSPCNYNYKYILKMETFSRDSAGILRQLGLSELADVNQLNGSKAGPVRSNQSYQDLLKNVDAETLKKLLDMYHLDFVLFGYDLTEMDDIILQKIKKS